jgi:hypothetical protein
VGWAGVKGRIRLLIREHRLLLRVVIGAVAFLFVALLLWQLVDPRTPEQRTAFIQTVGGIVGGSALLFGLYFTARNLQVSQEGQITERFTRAIDQLGSDKIEIRLGGIYALERIARDSERDHWPIMEVLTAYGREHAPRRLEEGKTRGDDGAKEKPEEDSNAEPASTDVPPPDPDVQAIMTVIGRRTHYWRQGETEFLDLRGIDLRGADLRKANFVGADLRRANLLEANLVQEQVEHVKGDDTTTLPNYLTSPDYWSVNSDEPPESG